MPNWCFNQLKLTCSEDSLKRFYEENKNNEEDQELDFLKSVPQPEHISSTNGDLSSNELLTIPNWYNWNLSNLGTKWNVRDAEYINNNENIIYNFETAWSPPIPWVFKVSIKYSEITFELDYSEEAMGFAGLIEIKNGNVIKEIDKDPQEEIFKELKNEIIEIINNFLKEKDAVDIKDLDSNNNEELLEDIIDEIDTNLGFVISDEKLKNLIKEIITELKSQSTP